MIFGVIFLKTVARGGGGGHTYVGAGNFFGVQNFEVQVFFGFSEK